MDGRVQMDTDMHQHAAHERIFRTPDGDGGLDGENGAVKSSSRMGSRGNVWPKNYDTFATPLYKILKTGSLFRSSIEKTF